MPRPDFDRHLRLLEDDILIVLELSTVLAARDFIKAELRPAELRPTVSSAGKGGRA